VKPELTIDILIDEAAKFSEIESIYDEPSLYGVTDGKAVGTYLEHKFMAYLSQTYSYDVLKHLNIQALARELNREDEYIFYAKQRIKNQ